jgi:hypothetical protein
MGNTLEASDGLAQAASTRACITSSQSVSVGGWPVQTKPNEKAKSRSPSATVSPRSMRCARTRAPSWVSEMSPVPATSGLSCRPVSSSTPPSVPPAAMNASVTRRRPFASEGGVVASARPRPSTRAMAGGGCGPPGGGGGGGMSLMSRLMSPSVALPPTVNATGTDT